MRWLALLTLGLLLTNDTNAAPLPTGLVPEVQVSELTRFDWQFAAHVSDPTPGTLPRDYDSRRQFYVLYAPRTYDPARAWPLILFVSPGDDPLGWRHWQKTCEEHGVFFCAAYGAGNRTAPVHRARLILDAFDDLRRHYRIDPDRTYVAGFGAAGRFACALAFALPEHFAGVVLHLDAESVESSLEPSWSEPLLRIPYLRHRARARLSVAVATINAEDAGQYYPTLFEGLGIRTKAWPSTDALAEQYDWLEEGRNQRREDAKARPKLTVTPGSVPTPAEEAEQLVQTAESDLNGENVWRGTAFLEGVVQRWPKTEAGEKAVRLLRDLSADAQKRDRVRTQREAEERRMIVAEAQALEQSGRAKAALERWAALRKQAPESPEGMRAVDALKRLATIVSETPYFGAAFQTGSTTISFVAPDGPADRAGLRAGDVLVRFAAQPTTNLADVRRALATLKAGAKVEVERQRDGVRQTVMVQLTSAP